MSRERSRVYVYGSYPRRAYERKIFPRQQVEFFNALIQETRAEVVRIVHSSEYNKERVSTLVLRWRNYLLERNYWKEQERSL